MNKRTAAASSRIILTSFVMLLNIAAISSAVTSITWSNGGLDGDWNNTANWVGGVKPDAVDDWAKINMAAGPVFSTGRTATAYRVYLEGANGTITMSGGSLTTVNHIYMAALSTDTAILNMSGGTINIGSTSFHNLYCGQNGAATFNMSGGAMNIAGNFNVALNVGSNATVNLSGGTITCNVLSMMPSGGAIGTIDITSTGKLIIAGDVTLTINDYVIDGWITAYGGKGTVVYDYGITNVGKTTVWATVSNKATIPTPTNGAIYVPLSGMNLNWKAGAAAASHNVYFGTDVNDVNSAGRLPGDLDGNGIVDKNDMSLLAGYWLDDPNGTNPYAGVNDDNIVDFIDYALLAQDWMESASPVFKGNQTGTAFDPGTLAAETTYYWRIDEVNGPETIKGDVWSFTTTVASNDSNSIVGKIMCGYQGWFNTPTDGAGRGWVHWGSGGFSPTNCTVDMWPDMNEMGAGEKFLASDFSDGNDYYVFSPYKRDTVLRHFQWMAQYGIDGVYLQRFATEVTPGSLEFLHRNTVLAHCKEGANIYGKKYAVMYDLSGLSAGGTQKVIDDWKYLVDTMHVGRDADDHGYMTHKGKPVVAVWGIGFTGRLYTWAECLTLVNFLKDDPNYGGNTVMIGVNDNWRSNIGNTTLLATCTKADIISPWTVGRYNYGNSISWITSKEVPDKTWCNTNGKDYLPVIWPGFSWSNLKKDPSKFNQYPRYGGQFLWDQVKTTISTVGTNMIYVAMFDEVDEGTAIFKVTNNPPRPGGVNMFVTYSMDGYSKPSDEYLWLTGQAARALRGEISPVPSTRPARP
jgi:hypothetical protein